MHAKFNFVGSPVLSGKIVWQDLPNWPGQQEEGVRISFNLHGRVTRKRAIELIAEATVSNDVGFLRHLGNNLWNLDFDSAKQFFATNGEFSRAAWAHSSITCSPEIEVHKSDFDDKETTYIEFSFNKNEIALMIGQKICHNRDLSG